MLTAVHASPQSAMQAVPNTQLQPAATHINTDRAPSSDSSYVDEMPETAASDRAEPGRAAAGKDAPSAARSGASMAIGTLASRILGFIKGIVLGLAVAGTVVGDIFEAANTLPNLIFLKIGRAHL